VGLVIAPCSPGVFARAEGEACKPGVVGAKFAEQQLKEAQEAQRLALEARKRAAAHATIDDNAARLPMPGGYPEQVAMGAHFLRYAFDDNDIGNAALIALGTWGAWGREAAAVRQGVTHSGWFGRLLARFTEKPVQSFRLPHEGYVLRNRLMRGLDEFSGRYKELESREEALYRGIASTKDAETEGFALMAADVTNYAEFTWRVENPVTGAVETLRRFVDYRSDGVHVIIHSSTGRRFAETFQRGTPALERDIQAFENYFITGTRSRRDVPPPLARGSLTRDEQLGLEHQLKDAIRRPGRGREIVIEEALEKLNAEGTRTISKFLPTGTHEPVTISWEYQADGISAVVTGEGGKIVAAKFKPEYLGEFYRLEHDLVKMFCERYLPETRLASP
jgi:hypothetical protein